MPERAARSPQTNLIQKQSGTNARRQNASGTRNTGNCLPKLVTDPNRGVHPWRTQVCSKRFTCQTNFRRYTNGVQLCLRLQHCKENLYEINVEEAPSCMQQWEKTFDVFGKHGGVASSITGHISHGQSRAICPGGLTIWRYNPRNSTSILSDCLYSVARHTKSGQPPPNILFYAIFFPPSHVSLTIKSNFPGFLSCNSLLFPGQYRISGPLRECCFYKHTPCQAWWREILSFFFEFVFVHCISMHKGNAVWDNVWARKTMWKHVVEVLVPTSSL